MMQSNIENSNRKILNKHFTLIEILFAVVILAMSLGVTLAISAQAKGELIRARERWLIQHVLEQVTEYYLLVNPDDLKAPDEMLPEGFHADCRIDMVDDGLPEFATVDDYNGWKLAVYSVALFNRSGDLVGEQVVHKIIPAE